MYKISIIVSLLDSEKDIMDIVNSFLSQTFDFNELDIIFVYNNSDNFTGSIIKSLLKWYPNISEYKVTSNNKWDAYSVGLKNATADYVLLINENYNLFDYTFKSLFNLISNSYVAFGNYILEKNGDYYLNNFNVSFKNGYAKLNDKYQQLKLLDVNFPIELILFKKDFLRENWIELENNSFSNFVLLMKIFSNANSINLINKPLFKVLANKKYVSKNIYDKNIFLNLIDAYDFVLDDLKNKLVIKKAYSDKISYILNQLIFSKISNEDKLDLMYSLNRLFEKYGILTFYTKTRYEKLLFILIKEKKYLDALNIIDFLNSSEDYFLKRIKSKDILCLFYGFEYDIGGLAKAVFNRVNLLSEKGHNVILLNVDPFTDDFLGPHFVNISFIEENFRNLNYIHPSVKFYNALQYFHDRYSNDLIKKDKELSSLFISEKCVKQLVEYENGIKIYNCYSVNEFDEEEYLSLKISLDDSLNSDIGDIRDEYGFKKVSKREYYINNSLYLESLYDENNKIFEENLYSTDGFNYLKIFADTNGINYRLYDKESKSQITFSNIEKLWDYFIEQICLGLNEKPFLINDCSGKIPSFTNISSNLVYKIANIHSNPYLEPTYDRNSPMRKIAALDKVDDLGAIVTLTPSEKEDFSVEFPSNNIFSVPNLIDLDEIKEYDKKHFEKEKNKISIFSRIAKEKNLGDLIKAFKIVISKHPGAILNIYGRALTDNEKKEFVELKMLIKELNLEDNVFFKGHVDNSYEEMRTSLITVLVSHIEGFGMVLIESMANKTPVISYDINYGPRDVISNGVDGFIVEKYDINQLSNKISYLLDNPEIAIKMGETAQKNIFEKFNTDKIYKKWINVFKNAYIDSIINDNLKINGLTKLNDSIGEKEQIIDKQNLTIKNNNEQIGYDENLINSLNLNLNYQKEIISKQNKIISNKNNLINNNKNVISKIKSKQSLQNKIFADKNQVLKFFSEK